ncbi:MAG: hypothetical protein WCV83_02680 [Candidatus Magasanikbacteria bacterium]
MTIDKRPEGDVLARANAALQAANMADINAQAQLEAEAKVIRGEFDEHQKDVDKKGEQSDLMKKIEEKLAELIEAGKNASGDLKSILQTSISELQAARQELSEKIVATVAVEKHGKPNWSTEHPALKEMKDLQDLARHYLNNYADATDAMDALISEAGQTDTDPKKRKAAIEKLTKLKKILEQMQVEEIKLGEEIAGRFLEKHKIPELLAMINREPMLIAASGYEDPVIDEDKKRRGDYRFGVPQATIVRSPSEYTAPFDRSLGNNSNIQVVDPEDPKKYLVNQDHRAKFREFFDVSIQNPQKLAEKRSIGRIEDQFNRSIKLMDDAALQIVGLLKKSKQLDEGLHAAIIFKKKETEMVARNLQEVGDFFQETTKGGRFNSLPYLRGLSEDLSFDPKALQEKGAVVYLQEIAEKIKVVKTRLLETLEAITTARYYYRNGFTDAANSLEHRYMEVVKINKLLQKIIPLIPLR